MNAVGTTVRGLGTVGVGAVVLPKLPSLPAWCVLVCALAALALAGLQTVMPQESADRLAWWINRREHRCAAESATRETRDP